MVDIGLSIWKTTNTFIQIKDKIYLLFPEMYKFPLICTFVRHLKLHKTQLFWSTLLCYTLFTILLCSMIYYTLFTTLLYSVITTL